MAMNAWQSEHSLLHPRNGYSAQVVQAELGVSARHEARELRRRLERVEHALVVNVRGFRGERLGVEYQEAVPGPDGWLLWEDGDYTAVNPGVHTPHGRVIDLDTEALAEEIGGSGCTEALTTTTDHQSTSKTATDCSAVQQWIDGNGYICFKFDGSATGQLQKLATYWCAPEGDTPDEAEPDYWMYGPPAIWIELAVGSECGGQCATYVVPGWAAGTGGASLPEGGYHANEPNRASGLGVGPALSRAWSVLRSAVGGRAVGAPNADPDPAPALAAVRGARVVGDHQRRVQVRGLSTRGPVRVD